MFSMGSLRVGTITVIGKDKTGVIARVTNFLFEHGANIEALEEQVTRGQFSMTLQASWPETRWVPQMIEAGLTDLGRSLGMEIAVNFNPFRTRQRMAIFASLESHAPEGILESVDKGTLKADPSSFPLSSGRTSPIAFAAPVDVGIIDKAAARDL